MRVAIPEEVSMPQTKSQTKPKTSKMTVGYSLKPRSIVALDARTLEITSTSGKVIIKRSTYDIGDLTCVACRTLEECDLSALSSLTDARLTHNGLPSFQLEGVPLRSLLIANNPLEDLDLDLPELTHLDAGNCRLTTVDLSRTPDLETLCLSNNPLEEIDLSTLTRLDSMVCRLEVPIELHLARTPGYLETVPLTRNPDGTILW